MARKHKEPYKEAIEEILASGSEKRHEVVEAYRKADSDLQRAEFKDRTQNTELRKLYTKRIFWVVIVWLGAMLVLVTLTAIFEGFKLEASVLIALITTTTLGVIGLMTVVLTYLFPRK